LILTNLFALLNDLKNANFSDALFKSAKEQALFNIDITGDDPEYFCSLISEETLLFEKFIETHRVKTLISSVKKNDVKKIFAEIFNPTNFNFIFYGNMNSLQKENIKKLIESQNMIS
jgi:predicted Zn-dependent peptidase